MMAMDVHSALTVMAFRDFHIRSRDKFHLMALIVPNCRSVDAEGFTSQRIDANLFMHRDSLVNMKFGDFNITRLPVFFCRLRHYRHFSHTKFVEEPKKMDAAASILILWVCLAATPC